jgi:hypothetical protein
MGISPRLATVLVLDLDSGWKLQLALAQDLLELHNGAVGPQSLMDRVLDGL